LSSFMGRASMSPRRATRFPGFPPLRSATTPHSVPPKPIFTMSQPIFFNSSATALVVSTSCQAISGCV